MGYMYVFMYVHMQKKIVCMDVNKYCVAISLSVLSFTWKTMRDFSNRYWDVMAPLITPLVNDI